MIEIVFLAYFIALIAVGAYVLWAFERREKIRLEIEKNLTKMKRIAYFGTMQHITVETLSKLLNEDSLIYVPSERWHGKTKEFAKIFARKKIRYVEPGIYAYSRAEVETKRIAVGYADPVDPCITVRFWDGEVHHE